MQDVIWFKPIKKKWLKFHTYGSRAFEMFGKGVVLMMTCLIKIRHSQSSKLDILAQASKNIQ